MVFLSVFIVSLVSLVGIFTLLSKKGFFEKNLFFLVALAAGTLLGDAFLHLIPKAFEMTGEATLDVSLAILAGFIGFLGIEKVLHWHHHHGHEHEEEIKSFGPMNLLGDAIHNFLDGTLIAGSFLVSVPLGITTSIAVILHEIPQEVSDFGVLIAAGYSRKKALLFNFFSALTAVLGAFTVLFLQSIFSTQIEIWLISFTAGAFIYIAATDLLPELNREKKLSLSHAVFFVIGILAMLALLSLE